MSAPAEWTCAIGDLTPGTTRKLRIARGDKSVDGFVVHFDGRVYAWVNQCPHVGTPLDLWPNDFLSDDGRLVVCATHGAVFEPSTGQCLGGPCVGDRLTPLTLERDGDRIVVRAE